MHVFRTRAQMREWSLAQKRAGRTIGFVPTMGNLHEGHLSLMREAKRRCDAVAASVFVNPIQFGPNEDYAAYPRTEAADLALCEAEGVDAVFLPSPEEMYAPDASACVDEGTLSKGYCGAQRPGHFRGVCTVVAKLFHLVVPDVAVFGQKDFQQVAVLRRMVRDLDFPVEIVRAPIVRDADGLAKSSRNAYLSPEARERALSLSRSLRQARDAVAAGERSAAALEAAVRRETESAGWIPDYAVVADAETLEPLETVKPGFSVLLLACRSGGLRLIDNTLL